MRASMCRASECKGKKSERAYWKDIVWKERKLDQNEWTEGAGTLLLAGEINTLLTGSKGRHILRRPHIFDGRDFLRATEVTHGLETAELWHRQFNREQMRSRAASRLTV
jgi:hypothetical protein